jgi:hypothetical protein
VPDNDKKSKAYFASVRILNFARGAELFPDLEGLCAHLEWLYTNLADEVHGSEKYDLQKVFMPLPKMN